MKGISGSLLWKNLVLALLILARSALCFAPTEVARSSTEQQKQQPRRALAQPIDPEGWPHRFPAKEHCSRCGLCETSFVAHVKDACAFLDDGMRETIDSRQEQVHKGSRGLDPLPSSSNDRFGVLHEPMKLARGVGMDGAQWTGAVTSIALALLETNQVDAVVCIANDSGTDTWSSPQPIVARTREDVLRGRGVKPALAPSLSVLDEVKADPSIRRLLFCGVGCAVQAFRAVQDQLMATSSVEEVYVLGTNCADNSPTPQAADQFLRRGVQVPRESQILGYEFMTDFRVHVKTKNIDDGDTKTAVESYVTRPYFSLPPTIAESSIAYSCRACFDYTNALADVVVGYMGAPYDPGTPMHQSAQTLAIRNPRGLHMVETATRQGRLWVDPAKPIDMGKHESFAVATVLSDTLVENLVKNVSPGAKTKADENGGDSTQGMPVWMGEIMATVMRTIGPKGLAFARYSIDYHVLRNYFHVLILQCQGNEQKAMAKLPSSSAAIVREYLDNDKQIQSLASQVKQQFQL